MRNVFKKLLCLFFPIVLAANGAMALAQSAAKPQTKKRSTKRPAKTKTIIGPVVARAITKEMALENPTLLKDVQDKLLKGEGNDHDTPMALAEVGELSSVPALIAVLKRNPALPGGSMVCTRAHCLVALMKLTGVNVGETDEAWEKWWEEYRKTH